MNAIPRETHREMILNPFKWPHLVLPIKRWVNGKLDTAVIHGGMTRLSPNAKIVIRNNTTIWGELPGGAELIEYENVDALLDDGWVVD